jgi:adenine-specific DNA-methyltransferase
MKKQKLELMWIGKEERPRLEPRILLEDKNLSYHAPHRISDKDIFDNVLIKGDNLLGLKALEQEFAGKVKCVYIDPPFNIQAATDYYDDGLEHSEWLNRMKSRFEILRKLLADEGFLIVHLDDEEMAYCKVVLDEVFGRSNYINTITLTTNDPSGFKATSSKLFSTANYLLVFAKNKSSATTKRLYVEKGYDAGYSKVLENRNEPYENWRWRGISEVVAEKLGFPNAREAKKALKESFDAEIADYAMENAGRVFQLVAIGGGAKIKRLSTIQKSQNQRDVVFVHPNEDVKDFYIVNGRQIAFYEHRIVEVDGTKVPAEIITDVWTDISWNGIASEGGVEFKNGKKPEALIKRVFEIYTNEGDLVLDSFGGSGTTGAVAHKMRRRWIMVELGEHCYTHIIPRLKKLIDGEDAGGISRAVGWKGGGGFRFYELAPSLLKKDKWRA